MKKVIFIDQENWHKIKLNSIQQNDQNTIYGIEGFKLESYLIKIVII